MNAFEIMARHPTWYPYPNGDGTYTVMERLKYGIVGWILPEQKLPYLPRWPDPATALIEMEKIYDKQEKSTR